MRVCGKTGTAQVRTNADQVTGWNYWFASFAPYENPKYAVVVMVQSESGGSGGNCLRADRARHLRGDFEKGKRAQRRKFWRRQIKMVDAVHQRTSAA
jgi:cell division protein FtsI/penicillin-binding protein 2